MAPVVSLDRWLKPAEKQAESRRWICYDLQSMPEWLERLLGRALAALGVDVYPGLVYDERDDSNPRCGRQLAVTKRLRVCYRRYCLHAEEMYD